MINSPIIFYGCHYLFDPTKYMPASNESKLGLILTLHCSGQKDFGRNVFSRVDDGWANVV